MTGRVAVAVCFLLSGFAALLYQVVWQRALYGIYGINSESVTMIVTAFMLGLGLGSLAGGIASKRPGLPTLLVFAGVEASIGLFGFVSLGVFHAVGAATLEASAGVVFLVTFLLVLAPTMLMGSTLPLLVAHFVRASGNVGRSVGELYFVNTLGSAAASALAVLELFGRFGQAGTVRVAGATNLVVAALAVAMHVAARTAARPAAPRADGEAPVEAAS